MIQDIAALQIYHWNGRIDEGWLYLENATIHCAENAWTSYEMINTNESSSNFIMSVPVQHEFTVTSAGTYQFYLDVYVSYAELFGFGGASIVHSSWVAVYYPS